MAELTALSVVLPQFVWHSLLGIGVFAVLWLCGIGALALARIPPTNKKKYRWLFVYPAGATAIYYSINLSLRGFPFDVLGWALLLILIGAGLFYIQRHLEWNFWTIPGWKIWTPLAIAVVLSLALFFTGPTETTAGIMMSDTGYFSHHSVIFGKFGSQPIDLSIEGETKSLGWRTYLPILLGAALLDIPGFDPYFFSVISVPVIYLLVFASIAGPLVHRSGMTALAKNNSALLLFGLLWTMSLLPGPGIAPGGATWIVMSPQMILSLPLAFALAGFALEPKMTWWEYVLVGFIMIACIYQGKIVGLSIVVPLVFFSLLISIFSHSLTKSQKAIVMVAVVIVCMIAVVMLSRLIISSGYIQPGKSFLDSLLTTHTTWQAPPFSLLSRYMGLRLFPEPFAFAEPVLYVTYLGGVGLLLLALLQSRSYLVVFSVIFGVALSLIYSTLGAFGGALALATIAVSIIYSDKFTERSLCICWIAVILMIPFTIYTQVKSNHAPDYMVPMIALLLFHLAVFRSAYRDFRSG